MSVNVCVFTRPHPSPGLCPQQGRGWLPGSNPLHHEAFPPAGPFLLLLPFSHCLPLSRSQLAEALRDHGCLRPPAQRRPPQRLRQRPPRRSDRPGRVSVWVRPSPPPPSQSAAITITTTRGRLPLIQPRGPGEHPPHMSVLYLCMYVWRVSVCAWVCLVFSWGAVKPICN